jgi:hypothetical protein
VFRATECPLRRPIRSRGRPLDTVRAEPFTIDGGDEPIENGGRNCHLHSLPVHRSRACPARRSASKSEIRSPPFGWSHTLRPVTGTTTVS